MRKIIVIILSCLLSLNASAQRPDWPGQTYNVQRAMEHIDKGDYASAKESLQAEINENSKNGYAYLLLTMINSHDEQYGEALTSADKAIKYLPKRDKNPEHSPTTREPESIMPQTNTTKHWKTSAKPSP